MFKVKRKGSHDRVITGAREQIIGIILYKCLIIMGTFILFIYITCGITDYRKFDIFTKLIQIRLCKFLYIKIK